MIGQNGTVIGAPSKIAHGSGGLPLSDGDEFGVSVVPLGDVNGDGVTGLAVGASGNDPGAVEERTGSDREPGRPPGP